MDSKQSSRHSVNEMISLENPIYAGKKILKTEHQPANHDFIRPKLSRKSRRKTAAILIAISVTVVVIIAVLVGTFVSRNYATSKEKQNGNRK